MKCKSCMLSGQLNWKHWNKSLCIIQWVNLNVTQPKTKTIHSTTHFQYFVYCATQTITTPRMVWFLVLVWIGLVESSTVQHIYLHHVNISWELCICFDEPSHLTWLNCVDGQIKPNCLGGSRTNGKLESHRCNNLQYAKTLS